MAKRPRSESNIEENSSNKRQKQENEILEEVNIKFLVDNETISEINCPEDSVHIQIPSLDSDDSDSEEDEGHSHEHESEEDAVENDEEDEKDSEHHLHDDSCGNDACQDDCCQDDCCQKPAFMNQAIRLLNDLIAPISLQTFLEKYHKIKCLVTHKHDFFDLAHLQDFNNLEQMLEKSASDSIHAWIPNKKHDNKLDSISVEPEVALKLWETEAATALYFRASEKLEEFMCSSISSGLGMGFAQFYFDGNQRGEIETFVSRKGHVTSWHFDFQHNFTFQLQGVKKWYFKRDPKLFEPLRGATPHYVTTSNYEEQMKVNRMLDPDFERFPQHLDDDLENPVRSVTLYPGSVLYFPSGMWHRVETIEDSISINVSLTSASWGDVFSKAFHQILSQDARWRSTINGVFSLQDAQNQLNDLIKTIPEKMDQLLNQSTIIAPNLVQSYSAPVSTSKHYRKNALASIFPENKSQTQATKTQNQNQEEKTSIYHFHINFGGENLESLYDGENAYLNAHVPIIEYIAHTKDTFTMEDVLKKFSSESTTQETIESIFFDLLNHGVIIEVNE